MLLLSYLLYIKLIFLYITVLSDTPDNPTIFFFKKCSSNSSNINIKNYDSFGSYDNIVYYTLVSNTYILHTCILPIHVFCQCSDSDSDLFLHTFSIITISNVANGHDASLRNVVLHWCKNCN